MIDITNLKQTLSRPLEMNLSDAEEEVFSNATQCHICKGDTTSDDILVRDHDHLTGQFRGAAHQSCNLNYRLKLKRHKIPAFFHNLSGYDAHLIMSSVNI